MESIERKSRPLNQRAKASPLSAITFAWLLPTFWSGLKREMEEGDLPEPLDEHTSSKLGDNFARLWEEEVARAGHKRTPSLLRVIMKAYAAKCMLYGVILVVMECGVRFVQPMFIGMLVEYYTPGQKSVTRIQAYWYAGGIVLCAALNVFLVHPYMLAVLHLGMKFRVACCSLIYRKSLRLSKTALGETTVGQVVNLLSNDVNRLNIATTFMHSLWIGPLTTVMVTYLMWQEIQWAAVVGVAFMLAFIPLQAYLGKRTSVLRLKTALRTDERVRLMNEILSGIQVIKMYTWENPFADLVANARKREINQIRAISYIRGVLISLVMFTTRICLFFSILAYVLKHDTINARQVFVIASYYNILRQTMTVFFPNGIAQIAEARISIRRLQSFMLYEDTGKPVPGLAEIQVAGKSKEETIREEKSRKKIEAIAALTDNVNGDIPQGNGDVSLATLKKNENKNVNLLEDNSVGVSLIQASTKWIQSHTENTLTDISLTIKPGKITAVIGPVGCGKSSLLHVLLKELPLLSGSVHIGGTVSYASQEPWLFAGSIRQNILFGQAMDRPRYNAVVRRCALDRDFQLFPHGDMTMVGERGVTLSGGQKARISLARAVYKRADVYLLDDPLSAVDTNVGRHLFESCLVGYLGNSTRILVTHQLQFLRDVDQIIILKNGTIAASGDFATLSASGLDFASLLTRKQEQEENKIELTKEEKLSPDMNTGSIPRQKSKNSLSSEDNDAKATAPQEAEQRSTGAVSSKVYTAYLKATGHPLIITLMVFIAVLAQVLGSASDWWISYWVNQEEAYSANILHQMEKNTTDDDIEMYFNMTKSYIDNTHNINSSLSRYDCMYVYCGIMASLVFISLLRSFMFFNLAMRASTTLHNGMFSSIVRAPMRFFHSNPSGRILNRFSKDMGSVDEILPPALLDVLQIGLSLIGIVTVVGIVNYWLLLPTLAIVLVFYLLRIVYLPTSRCIKRLEGVTRSPVFSHLNASLQGITTIRAFGAQEALIREFDNHQDLHSSAWYLFIASSRAFGFWLDLVCVIYIALVTLSFLIFNQDENSGNVGLAITQAMGLTGMFQWGMRQSAELENQMTSVERIKEYSEVELEPPLESEISKKPPQSWPELGQIEFKHVYLHYAPEEPAVLKDLNFKILPKEKIGIVGRTGAGKSSLIYALFRLTNLKGDIVIDGHSILSLGLHDLRSQLSIIPQEPVLFSGTMRHNLDPFGEFPDQVLWTALEEVKLKEAVMDLSSGLTSHISEGGGNFSVGQRQLVCLARAIVRRNKLLVLDEATANVDPQTDALIQTTIKKKFAECTVLTIAHRLHTVMDSDKILVMDAGRIVEFSHPHLLLQKPESVLRGMVEQTGRGMADTLAAVAKQTYERYHQPREKTD